MGAVETNFDEVQNIFDTGGCKGLTGDSVEKIPKITITSDNNFDASGERVSCSVCLQVCVFAVFPWIIAVIIMLSLYQEKNKNPVAMFIFIHSVIYIKIIQFGIDILDSDICRTFNLERQLEACLIAITCSTYHA